jgi:hypothetical protein
MRRKVGALMRLPVPTRLADWLIARSQLTPYWHLKGYMDRYWLLPFKDGSWKQDNDLGQWPTLTRIARRLGVAARIHHILRSDDDRAHHDHPWPFVTIILRGGYTEVRPVFDKSNLYIGESRKFYGVGSVLFRRAKDWHRLELYEDMDTWTLFIVGKYQQKWGFLKEPRYKVYYRDHFNQDEGNAE